MRAFGLKDLPSDNASDQSDPAMSLILSHDAALYYEEYGAGETLILLHGLMGSIERDWRRFLPVFSRYFHVLAVDLRGHGRTNNPSGTLRFPQLLGDLHTVFESLQIDRACLCGYDVGGYLACVYAVGHPARVSGLVLHATRPVWNERNVRDAISRLGGENGPLNAPAHRPNAPSASSPGDGTDLQGQCRALLEKLPQHRIPGESASAAFFPVLVTLGDGDETMELKEAGSLASMVPRGRLLTFHKTSHHMHTLRTEPFVQAVVSVIGHAEPGFRREHRPEKPEEKTT